MYVRVRVRVRVTSGSKGVSLFPLVSTHRLPIHTTLQPTTTTSKYSRPSSAPPPPHTHVHCIDRHTITHNVPYLYRQQQQQQVTYGSTSGSAAQHSVLVSTHCSFFFFSWFDACGVGPASFCATTDSIQFLHTSSIYFTTTQKCTTAGTFVQESANSACACMMTRRDRGRTVTTVTGVGYRV